MSDNSAEDTYAGLEALERLPVDFPEDIDITEEDIKVRDEILLEMSKLTANVTKLCSTFDCMVADKNTFLTHKKG